MYHTGYQFKAKLAKCHAQYRVKPISNLMHEEQNFVHNIICENMRKKTIKIDGFT